MWPTQTEAPAKDIKQGASRIGIDLGDHPVQAKSDDRHSELDHRFCRYLESLDRCSPLTISVHRDLSIGFRSQSACRRWSGPAALPRCSEGLRAMSVQTHPWALDACLACELRVH